MVRTKVFIGNLSFKTREAELAQQFEAVAKVVSVNIITRGPRSLGYGFVELESEEDAKKAVAAMDKKEVDGRPINVDLAKPRAEGEAAPAGAEGSSPKPNAGRRPRQPRAPRANANAAPGSPSAAGNATGSPAAEGAARPPRRPRQSRQPKAEGDAAAPAGNADGAARPPRRPRQPRQPKAEGEAGSASPSQPKAPRQPRPPRTPTDTSNRVPSETSLFVANLPFALTNESFGKLLTDHSLKYKKAHVVTKRNQKSKGFGFVEFDNQEDQKKALDTLTGKKIEDRELVPKVALVDPKKPADAVPQGSPATAPASAEAKTN